MDNQKLSEGELRNIFSGSKSNFQKNFAKEIPKSKPSVTNRRIYLKFFLLFVFLFVFFFILINFSAFSKKGRYFWDVQLKKQAYTMALVTPAPQPVFDPLAPAKIVIPKIGVEAPIVWNVAEEDIQKKLLEGLVHSQGTALPGEKGNVFITGHSSYYSWSSSPYKDVFALLEKMAVGDKIYLEYQGKTFVYEVIERKVVSPKETSVLNQGNDYNLTLMTCVPVGTNLNRLIIKANQI